MASTDGRRGVAASAASRRACTKALCPGASVPLQGAMTNTGAAPWSRGRPSAQSAGTGSGLVTAMVITCMPSPNKTLFPAPCLLQFAVWLMLFVTQTQGDTRFPGPKVAPRTLQQPARTEPKCSASVDRRTSGCTTLARSVTRSGSPPRGVRWAACSSSPMGAVACRRARACLALQLPQLLFPRWRHGADPCPLACELGGAWWRRSLKLLRYSVQLERLYTLSGLCMRVFGVHRAHAQELLSGGGRAPCAPGG